jgi:hypothetical protein
MTRATLGKWPLMALACILAICALAGCGSGTTGHSSVKGEASSLSSLRACLERRGLPEPKGTRTGGFVPSARTLNPSEYPQLAAGCQAKAAPHPVSKAPRSQERRDAKERRASP